VFDIGGPEFLVIAIVALVVLGPERLPEVMRRAGLFYRQARQMLNEYTSEAQRMFDEGMREVNEVSNTISGTFQEATAETAATIPPPALLQLPPPLLAPDKAANAGPWTLASWYRDTRADLEPQGDGYPQSPSALATVRREREEWLDDSGFLGIGGPSLMGPAMAEDENGPAAEPGVPREPGAPPDGARVDRALPTAAPAREPEREVVRAPVALPEPALAIADEGQLFLDEDQVAHAPANGKVRAVAEAKDPATVRQEVLVELYRTGDITLEKAAEFLGITPGQFRGLLRRK